MFGALRAGTRTGRDSLRPPRFRFWAEGERTLEMGDEAAAGSWTLRVRTPLPARLRLLRDGEEVASARGDALAHHAEGPGVYRVEAYRDAHGRERTWILSNPIYLRG